MGSGDYTVICDEKRKRRELLLMSLEDRARRLSSFSLRIENFDKNFSIL